MVSCTSVAGLYEENNCGEGEELKGDESAELNSTVGHSHTGDRNER